MNKFQRHKTLPLFKKTGITWLEPFSNFCKSVVVCCWHHNAAKKTKLGLDSVPPPVFIKNKTRSLSRPLDNLCTHSVREQGMTNSQVCLYGATSHLKGDGGSFVPAGFEGRARSLLAHSLPCSALPGGDFLPDLCLLLIASEQKNVREPWALDN